MINEQKSAKIAKYWKAARQIIPRMAVDAVTLPLKKSEIALAYGSMAYLAGPARLTTLNAFLGIGILCREVADASKNNNGTIDLSRFLPSLAIIFFSLATTNLTAGFSQPWTSDEKALTAIAAGKIRHGAHLVQACRDYKSGIGLGLGDGPRFRRDDLFFCIDVVPANNKDGYEVLSLQAYRPEKPGPQAALHEFSQ